MTTLAVVAAITAGALHVGFFLLEAVFFMKPSVYRLFGARDHGTAESQRILMINQGFYNLALGAGAIGGAIIFANDHSETTLIRFACAFMVAAAVMLMATLPRAWKGALVQGLPPLIALAAMVAS